MGMVMAAGGLADMLGQVLNNIPVAGTDIVCHLYVTNISLDTLKTPSDFVEAVGGGYLAKTLTGGSWSIHQGDAGTIPNATYTQQEYIFTGPLTTNLVIYGYYLVNAAGHLLAAETLGAPFTPYNNWDELKISPRIQFSHGTPIL